MCIWTEWAQIVENESGTIFEFGNKVTPNGLFVFKVVILKCV